MSLAPQAILAQFPKAMPQQTDIASLVARCGECEWCNTTEKAMAFGIAHARRTGHAVKVERHVVTVYNPPFPGVLTPKQNRPILPLGTKTNQKG